MLGGPRAVSICRDFAEDPLLLPWKDRALANGFRCSTSLPLSVGGVRLGAVTMYSRARETFDDEELQLLSRLAANLSLGVRSLRERAALGLTEKERDWRRGRCRRPTTRSSSPTPTSSSPT